ncbi:MAG: class I SAM-dependent methyltransferase [Rhodobacteraceae bacterium]|nr:class I SAM-dependent methyltransferase [Paracoccaceae bacterium]
MPGRQLSDANRRPNDLDMNIHLSHDDTARAKFLITLKQRINLGMGTAIRTTFNQTIAPALSRKLGHTLDDLSKDDRKAAKAELEKTDIYKAWAAATYISQGIMWEIVDGALEHDLPRLQNAFDTYSTAPNRRGSLKLNPSLKVPKNISQTEIHRQPGGFCYETNDRDITAGARYNGGGLMYSFGKGRKAQAGKSGGDWVLEQIGELYPDFKPNRILEVGCGTGRNTPAYGKAYPKADIHAIDVAPGLLRWAHAYAESEGVPVHFAQMDATALDYPDESFDLVVSHILGHETTQRGLPMWISEAWRVLKPGGVMFHLDVTIQPGHLKLADLVMNDWQVRFNGEPFWMGFADADFKGIMNKIGIPADAMFAQHLGKGAGVWFCHGARKPKDWSAKTTRAA